MPPGGREAFERWLLLVCWCWCWLFGPATDSTRTGFSLLLHTSELVFCVRPERRAGTPGTDGGTDGWRQPAPFQAAFSNLSGSESAQNPVSIWQALHIFLIKSEKPPISVHRIDKLLSDELIWYILLCPGVQVPPLYKNTPVTLASRSRQPHG